MNRLSLVVAAATVFLATAPASSPLEAAAALQRCKSSDGGLVYTDKGCAALGAESLPIPGDLLSRIAREESTDARHNGTDVSALPDNVMTSSYPVSARRGATSGCARTPTQLSMDLAGALALGDVNRVAESYHWAGMSTRQGERTLDRLQHLTGRQVVDSHYYDARITSSDGFADAGTLLASSSADVGGDAGILQVMLDDDGVRSAIDFDVHKYAGCYFVSF